MMWPRACALLTLMVTLTASGSARAQATGGEDPPAQVVARQDPDRRRQLAQPDFTLVNLPTTLRLPRFASAFRVTHRFARPLGRGDFGSLVEDLFGIDGGAQIGLEYRFGIVRGGQVGIHRTSDRTVEFFGQYDLVQQDEDHPVGMSVLATIDGTNNFRDHYTPALGVILSRTVATRGAVYLEPIWVHDVNPLPSLLPGAHRDAFVLGVGGRLRVRPTVYLVAEVSPRLAGYAPGRHQAAFGLEKRAGGHVFQLNVSNGLGTTIGQIARGGAGSRDWFIGFNIARKFF